MRRSASSGHGRVAAAPSKSGLLGACECMGLSTIRCTSISGGILFDPPQETQELLVPMPGFALGDHRTGGHVQDGQKCGGAVTDGVVGDTLDVAQTHRQQRLGAIAGLVLRFLVNAEQNCLIGREEVEPYDVSQRLAQERIVAELVAFRLARGGTFSGDGAAERRSAASGSPYFWRCL